MVLKSMLCFFVQKQIGADSVAASDMERTMRYVMRAMPLLIIPLVAKFPAVCISLVFVQTVIVLLIVGINLSVRLPLLISVLLVFVVFVMKSLLRCIHKCRNNNWLQKFWVQCLVAVTVIACCENLAGNV